MSKRSRDASDREGPAMNRSGGPSGWVGLATLAAVAVVLFLGIENWNETRALKTTLTERLGQLDTRLTQMSAKVDSAAARAAAPAQRGPDPNRVYAVKLDGAPFEGPKDAPVVIAEFSDFQCPFCARVGATIDQIRKVYGDKVKVVWKHFPLDIHPKAPLAHMASVAAAEQGKFWEFHDKIFADQQQMDQPHYVTYARQLGLDVKRFEQSILTAHGKTVIDADSNEGKSLGLTGTPAFFVNGKFLSGAKPFEEFAQTINAELTRLKIPIPPGAPQGGG